MFCSEDEYRPDEKGGVPILPRFGRELKERVVSTPGIEKCVTAYPLSEQKKLAVCNFLVSMRVNEFRSEHTVR